MNLPRPRHMEHPDVARTAREILDRLREEINKSWKWSTPMKKLAKHVIFYARADRPLAAAGEIAHLAAVSFSAAPGSWRTLCGTALPTTVSGLASPSA